MLKINGHVVGEGTVISGTLRQEDLISELSREIARLSTVNPDIVHEAETWLEGEEIFFSEYAGDDYDSAGSEIITELINQLNSMAPDEYYFGTHPGDGADLGWWSFDEE